MKYIKYILAAILLVVAVLGASLDFKVQKTEFMMDTVITAVAYGKNANSAINEVFDEIKRLDNLLNCHNANSEISKINYEASDHYVKTTDEVFALLKETVKLSQLTDGAFDITLKPVSELWGIGTDYPRVPDKSEIEAALLKTGYYNLELNEEEKSVHFKVPGMAIDLGAVAKGYAADRAVDILKENDVKNAVLDLGGNVAVIGKKPLKLFEAIKRGSFNKPFVIGIQNPDAPRGELIKTVTANEDIFVITSGSYERFFTENGVRYHHIIDPKTGMPAQSGLKSATVITKNGVLGDALSTAAFVIGEEKIKGISDLCLRVILTDSALNVTDIGKE